jgi:phage baseplate assembly protein W
LRAATRPGRLETALDIGIRASHRARQQASGPVRAYEGRVRLVEVPAEGAVDQSLPGERSQGEREHAGRQARHKPLQPPAPARMPGCATR